MLQQEIFGTSLTNAIITNIIQVFNDEDLDGSLIDVSYAIQRLVIDLMGQLLFQKINLKLWLVYHHFISIFLNQKINNLRSSFFGDVNNQITLSEDNILEMYEYDDGTYRHFESIKP